MNCPDKKKPVRGGGSFKGSKFKSRGNFMNCRENRYLFLTPPEDGEREGWMGGRGQGGRKGEGGRQGRSGPSEAG